MKYEVPIKFKAKILILLSGCTFPLMWFVLTENTLVFLLTPIGIVFERFLKIKTPLNEKAIKSLETDRILSVVFLVFELIACIFLLNVPHDIHIHSKERQELKSLNTEFQRSK